MQFLKLFTAEMNESFTLIFLSFLEDELSRKSWHVAHSGTQLSPRVFAALQAQVSTGRCANSQTCSTASATAPAAVASPRSQRTFCCLKKISLVWAASCMAWERLSGRTGTWTPVLLRQTGSLGCCSTRLGLPGLAAPTVTLRHAARRLCSLQKTRICPASREHDTCWERQICLLNS